MMIFACVNKACFIFLQAMGKAAASTALSMIREIVFGVGFALTLPRIYPSCFDGYLKLTADDKKADDVEYVLV